MSDNTNRINLKGCIVFDTNMNGIVIETAGASIKHMSENDMADTAAKILAARNYHVINLTDASGEITLASADYQPKYIEHKNIMCLEAEQAERFAAEFPRISLDILHGMTGQISVKCEAVHDSRDGGFDKNTTYNTTIDYRYRDAGNFKTINTVTVSGAVTQAQIKEILESTDHGDFIPEQVGLPCERFGSYDEESDTPYAELENEACFRLTTQPPDVDMTINALLENFKTAAAAGWGNVDLGALIPGYSAETTRPYVHEEDVVVLDDETNKKLAAITLKDSPGIVEKLSNDSITDIAAYTLCNNGANAIRLKNFYGFVLTKCDDDTPGVGIENKAIVYIRQDGIETLKRLIPDMADGQIQKMTAMVSGAYDANENSDESEAE